MKTFLEWLQIFESNQGIQYISPDEYENRLEKLGWRVIDVGTSHRMALAPDGVGKTTWTVNKVNWEKNWRQVARDLLKKSRSPVMGYGDLEFVWRSIFQIPSNFNYETQALNQVAANNVQNLMVARIHDLESLIGKQIGHNNQWKTVKMIDYGSDGNSIDVLFDDLNEDPVNFKLQQTISIREPKNNYSMA